MNARQWLAWTPDSLSPEPNGTDKTGRSRPGGAFVGSVSSFRRRDARLSDRVDVNEADRSLQRLHADLSREYVVGAIPWAMTVADLLARMRDAEGRLDTLARVPDGPLRADWTAAVEAFRRVLQEIVHRYKERHRGAQNG